jgi:hypothetical protein
MTMLKHPFLSTDYEPKLQYFLGPFDTYDCEESLGEDLERYDINKPGDREALINAYIIDKSTDLNYRHRKSLVDILSAALQEDSYDFSTILIQKPESYCTLPSGWDTMENPRAFFEDIYRLTKEGWKDDLQKASLEDQSDW